MITADFIEHIKEAGTMNQQELPDELYLPVLFRAPGTGKKIAVTVDGCDHIGNLRRIIRIFDRYGADLTLFSIGRTFAAQETVSQTCAYTTT